MIWLLVLSVACLTAVVFALDELAGIWVFVCLMPLLTWISELEPQPKQIALTASIGVYNHAMSQSAVASDSRESFEARLAGVLMLAYTVLTHVGPDVLREREAGGYDGNGDVGQTIQVIDGTVAKVVPWAQWLRDPSCDLSPSLGGKLSSLADGLVVSLVAISLSLAGSYNGMLTPENGLPGFDDEEVADWISARVTPETLAMLREVGGITPAS